MSDALFRVGTASWTDPTLLATGFYPQHARTPEARLRFYARLFDTVEIDATYYALPSERNAALWAERTPDGFVFHVKAFAWLTKHEAEVRMLPASMRDLVQSSGGHGTRTPCPSPALLRESFVLFLRALDPLADAGKLGSLLFQFPPWFRASDANRDYINLCHELCTGHSLAVEFRHASWYGDEAERTIEFLKRRDLILVVTDTPRAPSIPATPVLLTTDRAYVRLHGRDRQAWFKRGATAAQRFQYLYTDAELAEVATRVAPLKAARTVDVLFNNCYADYGVRGALAMKSLLPMPGP